mmetsp:Transcript_32694/g.44243  ORF Transcript_32694/g.44243 Transcript_32694/m.44243 type:complete len:471 (-) Transcript_32694:232-1644(-)
MDLCRVGLRAGVDWLDVEACWEARHVKGVVEDASRRYPATRLLGSYHVVGRYTSPDAVVDLFKTCHLDGRADAAKVVLTAFSETENFDVRKGVEAAALPCPCIAICLTEYGRLSRVLNLHMTPVTHKLMPSVAAPGQLTPTEIMTHRRNLFLSPSKFYLLGHPVQASPSPAMHNSAFERIGLPWNYRAYDTESVDDFVEKALSASDFGGASVTIPHKQTILPFLDELSPSAEAIGAVNTVIVKRASDNPGQRLLLGDNTDWLGIKRAVEARIPESSADDWGGIALVVGAGGTAAAAVYAMQSLGLTVIVYNRTPSKAQELAHRFDNPDGAARVAHVTEIEAGSIVEAAALSSPVPIQVVVSTVPATAGFELPEWVLQQNFGDSSYPPPVVLDAAYKPACTKLIEQATRGGCRVIMGAEMLLEQGMEQSEMWTHHRAPRHLMSRAILDTFEATYKQSFPSFDSLKTAGRAS